MLSYLNVGAKTRVPKYLQVADAITEAIRRGKLKHGQRILSINELSDEYLLSRDTVEKAYTILRNQGIIMSVKGKGYYIRRVDIDVPIKVLLLFSKISNYKEQIYRAFVEAIGKNAIVDFKIHHFNVDVLRNLIENHLFDYTYFVIMPHFYEDLDEAIQLIRTIPSDQLIILDKKIPYYDLKCGAVYQDFENDIVEALEEGSDLLAKYEKLYLVFPAMVPHPPEIVRGFRNFCLQNNFKYDILSEISDDLEIQKGEAYIVIEETHLAQLIKQCKIKNLKIGKEVGIVSYNETPLKEILLDGITVLSTDHAKMGATAAKLILENSCEKIKNPFMLIRRNSL